MKHQPFEPMDGLPYAPLSMPKQRLERADPFGAFIRAVFSVWQRG
jgi:hypothetical protein